ncbi:hypothetical protein JOF42_002431 [Microbacterium phyllosphaerae]|uniref:GAF domain-containing protein n=1 Tax=Microbacterium phyllosphaerae TaxID=124798 RepID=A0ABS4WRT6_9MICO|nr:hypothetical protein [Microbacterium phyllosphaerae]
MTSKALTVTLRLIALGLGVATALSGLNASNSPEFPELRSWTLWWGIATAVISFVIWLVDDWVKRIREGEVRTVEQLLEAERIRIATATNGAFLPMLKSLQQLSTMEVAARRAEISGFRQELIDRTSDLIRNDAPRLAYFRVDDLSVESRVMHPKPVSQQNRTDEFTSLFAESDPADREIFDLIDQAETALLRTGVTVPDRVYHCYVSAPVRAGGIAFGMLTANTLEPEGLSREDANNIVVMARILAAAEGLTLTTAERRAILAVSGSRSKI